LLTVHCPQEPIEAGSDPFVAQFPNRWGLWCKETDAATALITAFP
jgi:hypothetical protein